MLLTIEKVMVLKSAPIFSEVPDEHLADVAFAMSERHCKAGETLIVEGERSSTLYVIVSGRVRVSRGDVTVAHLGEREIVGELAALDPEPRSATVTAEVDVHLLELSHPHLEELMIGNLEMMRGMVRMLCRRLRAVS